MVQWPGSRDSTAGSMGPIPSQGAETPHAWHSHKKKITIRRHAPAAQVLAESLGVTMVWSLGTQGCLCFSNCLLIIFQLLKNTAYQIKVSKEPNGEGNGNPLQCSCLENPRDRGAWWAAVYGVAQSRTRLKRLSSGSSREPPEAIVNI